VRRQDGRGNRKDDIDALEYNTTFTEKYEIMPKKIDTFCELNMEVIFSAPVEVTP